jgi:uncharacterized protein GlcG (DUF336 family)
LNQKLTFIASVIVAFVAGIFLSVMLVGVGMSFAPSSTMHDESEIKSFPVNDEFPSHAELTGALKMVVKETNGGFGLNMWATMVDRDGIVQTVTFTGDDRGDQWPGSRVISAQKANTANAFSLPGLALSTANLFYAVQPGGSLYGLQASNPVDVDVAYGGSSTDYGTVDDPMSGYKIGGVNVFGGGLPLYDSDGLLIGAIGVSGDSSCADHIISWKVRDTLGLDSIPGGVSPTGDDNIIFDIASDDNGHQKSTSGWGHPLCAESVLSIAEELPATHPVG